LNLIGWEFAATRICPFENFESQTYNFNSNLKSYPGRTPMSCKRGPHFQTKIPAARFAVFFSRERLFSRTFWSHFSRSIFFIFKKPQFATKRMVNLQQTPEKIQMLNICQTPLRKMLI
jgi:hypothetical protein